ncbi:amidase family protein, partial [Mycobacterium sp. 1165196.3]|uniref:amidase family protein n=1 Tax=Mycobacterium sp. 1165196.3 TaxID=1834071 RepID=UPI0021015FE3
MQLIRGEPTEAECGRIRPADEHRTALQKIVDDGAVGCGDEVGPLAGVPVTVKINVDQAGYATTDGVTLQRDLIATTNSPVVDNLLKSGAVLIGRTN